jgi:hypothetical protein
MFFRPIPLAFLLFILPVAAPVLAQRPPATAEYQLTKVNRALISSPDFSFTGAQQYNTDQRERWLEVEAEFAAGPEWTDELTVRYFILINGRLLTGEVTHVNIAGGRDRRSVMYVSPRTLARIMEGRPLTPASLQNIGVQIVQQGAVRSEISLQRAQPNWYAAISQVPGFVLNKNETPFAPLYWDRYEQIKAATR